MGLKKTDWIAIAECSLGVSRGVGEQIIWTRLAMMTIDEALSLANDKILVMASRFDRTRNVRQLVVKGVDRSWGGVLSHLLVPYSDKAHLARENIVRVRAANAEK